MDTTTETFLFLVSLLLPKESRLKTTPPSETDGSENIESKKRRVKFKNSLAFSSKDFSLSLYFLGHFKRIAHCLVCGGGQG